MVYEPSGAGKTTFSMALARRRGGLTMSIDRWMEDLFGVEVSPAIFKFAESLFETPTADELPRSTLAQARMPD